MSFNAGTITFQEFMRAESLPLARLQEAALEFLRGRDDAVLFGAQAVNAYVGDPRMSQDLDILSVRAAELAEELRAHLHELFQIALRIRTIAEGRGYRLFQVRKPRNRHLVDVRSVDMLPPCRLIAEVRVLAPPELIASKVRSYHNRRGQPKSGTDWRDLALLLLTFPELKSDKGPVGECLRESGAGPAELALWRELVEQDIQPESEEDW